MSSLQYHYINSRSILYKELYEYLTACGKNSNQQALDELEDLSIERFKEEWPIEHCFDGQEFVYVKQLIRQSLEGE